MSQKNDKSKNFKEGDLITFELSYTNEKVYGVIKEFPSSELFAKVLIFFRHSSDVYEISTWKINHITKEERIDFTLRRLTRQGSIVHKN